MEWGIAYFRAPDGRIPAEEFLDGCPTKVEANLLAVLEAVRAAPPPAFSGGGNGRPCTGAWAATTRFAQSGTSTLGVCHRSKADIHQRRAQPSDRRPGSMTTATAAVINEPGASFSLEEVTLADPRPGEVLVKMVAAGICHTDLGVRAGGIPFQLPGVLGHEGAGVIAGVRPMAACASRERHGTTGPELCRADPEHR